MKKNFSILVFFIMPLFLYSCSDRKEVYCQNSNIGKHEAIHLWEYRLPSDLRTPGTHVKTTSSNDGFVIVSGSNGYNLWSIILDDNGKEVFQNRNIGKSFIPIGSHITIQNIKTTSSRKIVIAGLGYQKKGEGKIFGWVATFDELGKRLLWHKIFDSYVYDIDITQNEEIIVLSSVKGIGLSKLNIHGDTVWKASINKEKKFLTRKLRVSSDGTIFIAAEVSDIFALPDYINVTTVDSYGNKIGDQNSISSGYLEDFYFSKSGGKYLSTRSGKNAIIYNLNKYGDVFWKKKIYTKNSYKTYITSIIQINDDKIMVFGKKTYDGEVSKSFWFSRIDVRSRKIEKEVNVCNNFDIEGAVIGASNQVFVYEYNGDSITKVKDSFISN